MRNYSDYTDLTSDIIVPEPTSTDVAMMKLDSALRSSLHKTPRLELRPEYYPRPTDNALQATLQASKAMTAAATIPALVTNGQSSTLPACHAPRGL